MKKNLSILLITCLLLSSFHFTALGATLFQDNFNDGIAKWKVLLRHTDKGIYDTEKVGTNPALKLDTDTGNQAQIRSVMVGDGLAELTDYKADFKIKIDPQCEYFIVGIRAKNGENFYGLKYQKGYSNFVLIKNDYWKPIDGVPGKKVSESNFIVGDWNKMRVVTKGDNFKIYINDFNTPIFDYSDTLNPILNGGVSFAVLTGQPTESVMYVDDVKISTAEAEGAVDTKIGGAVIPNDVFGSPYENEIGLLLNLGLITPFEDGTFKEDAPISKADYAIVLASLLGINEKIEVAKPTFSDVLSDHIAFSAIEQLAKAGYISKDSENFNPDTPILLENIIVDLVKALGYETKANIKGGTFNSYMQLANELKILNGIDAKLGYTLTKGMFCKILANTLNTQVFRPVAFGSDITYKKDKTLLAEKFNIYRKIGLVNSNSITSLNGYSVVSDSQVGIGDDILDVGKTNVDNLVGYHSEAYYYDNNGETYIIYISKYKNDILKVDASKLIDFSNNVYSYYNDSETKTLDTKINVYTQVIYNGKRMSQSDKSYYLPNVGDVTFIDNNRDGNYEVVNIKSYTTQTVKNVDLDNKIIIDKYSARNNVNLGDDDFTYQIYNSAGANAALSSLSEWTIINVGYSDDLKNVIIISESKSFKAIVEEMQPDEKIVVLNGEEYKISPYFSDLSKIKTDTEIEFLFDSYGYIAEVKSYSNAFRKYGYLIDMQYSTKGLENSLLVQFFSIDDNKVIDNKLSNSAMIDGTKYVGRVAQKTYIETQIPFNQAKSRYDNAVFEYRLNKNGEISYLDLPYKTTVDQTQNLITTNRPNESKNSLNLAFASGSTLQYYRPNLLTFGNRISAKSNSIVLRIPDDRKNYDFYERTTFDQTFISGESYLVDGYALNENSRVCDIVVTYTNGDTSFRFLAPILIDKITEITNVQGIPTYKIYGYSRGGNVEFIVADDLVNKFNSDAQKKAEFKMLSKGDIVEITVDAFKKINSVTLKYRHSTIPANIKYTSYGSIASEQRYVAGDVYSVVDGLSSFIPINADSKVADMTVLSNIEIISLGIAKVFVVENNKITVGNVDSFNDYLRYGSARSRVFVFTEFAQPRYVVVYK